jgi:hypothetical protein
MPDLDYRAILNDAFTKLGLAIQQRDAAEIEIAKQKQFIVATLNMISDEERQHFRGRLEEACRQDDARTAGLTDAIRRVLETSGRKWRTVAEVRSLLIASGFDFSGYASNPLASISTTLRRMPPDEVETTKIETVTAYRLKARRSRMAEAFAKGRFNSNRFNK